MRRLVLAGDAPPGQSALQLRPSRAAGRNGRRWGAGKPPETAGRKATGTKAFLSDAAASAALPYRQEPALVASDGICYVSLAANYKRQTVGNGGTQNKGPKACAWTCAKAQATAARSLIIISKPLEMAGRKAMGAKVLEVSFHNAMPARPPDTLHPK